MKSHPNCAKLANAVRDKPDENKLDLRITYNELQK
jgi:hypothetical protein